MAEINVGMLLDVAFDLLPGAGIGAYFFAMGANRYYAFERFYLLQG